MLTMNINLEPVKGYYEGLDPDTKYDVDLAIERIVAQKRRGGRMIVATGSGPNLHEGVTTLIAELMDKGLVDGVLTSSAVVAHELAGTLDKVKRVDGKKLGVSRDLLPKGDTFEFTQMSDSDMALIRQEMDVDEDLIRRSRDMDGDVIIKAAGNLGYPMGLRTERLAREILTMAKAYGLPFEVVAGWGADRRTMIGIGAQKGLPVIVSVPQLIGGGGVGLAIADSISIFERCMCLARMLDAADVIIESAVALTQEIHDGPFECYTGHGIWANWDGYRTSRLEGKTIIRIDLDQNLKRAWLMERESQAIQEAVDRGLPKTKITGIPFRMEMSGFARLEGSVPIVGDIGVIWPIIAWQIASALGVSLDFISYPQQTPEGKEMREWIVEHVKPVNRTVLMEKARNYKS
jgi:hypothetical protein